jgi:hypothetical protein
VKPYEWYARKFDDDSCEVTVICEGETEIFVMRHLPIDEDKKNLRITLAVESLLHDRDFKKSNAALKARIDQLTRRSEELLAQTRTAPPSPPVFAELVISTLAPKNTAQALLGDLQEMFQANVRRLGEKEARRIYRMQVLASAGPLAWTWIKRIGVFTAFIDYVRSKFGF